MKELLKYSALGVVLMLTACSQEDFNSVVDNLIAGEAPEGIVVNVADFKNVYDTPQTRSTINVSSDGTDYQFVWDEDDVIGIFPNQGGQVAFPMAAGSGSKTATFDGGGWGLKASATYSAYYPLVPEFYLDKTKIPMDLSQQVQDGNGSYEHLGKVDYLAAINSEVNDAGTVTFNFEHQIAVLHFIITIPAGHYNSVMLMASDNLTTMGSLNLTNGDVTPEESIPLQRLQLDNCDVTDGEALEVFMAIRPVNLEGKSLKARIYGDNEVYVITLYPKNYEAGAFYHSTRTAVVDETNTGLPQVFVNTPCAQSVIDGDATHETWVAGSNMTILMPDGTVDYNGGMSIKGRGNNTWARPKKPYAIKLDSKSEILGMKKHKRWCLLANWMDRTLIRNAVAFEIAHKTDMDWNPSGKFVEVFFNGVHRGNYYLCEQIKVDKNRVNIKELDINATSGDGIEGGYIFELDTYYDEAFKFKSPIRDLPWQFKDPDEINDFQYNYVLNYVNQMENALYDDVKFANREFVDFMDLESYADWWLIYELMSCAEPTWPKSSYMHKDIGGKMKAGPVWDFDYGTLSQNWSNSLNLKNCLYYDKLFEDAQFRLIVKDKWVSYKPKFVQIIDWIDELAASLEKSQQINIEMWPISSAVNGDNTMGWDEAISRLKSYYQNRINVIDTEVNSY